MFADMHAAVAYLAPGMHAAREGRCHPYSQTPRTSPASISLNPWRRRAELNGLRLGNLHLPVAQGKGDHKVPRWAEAATVRVMRNLYSWSEFLIKHIEDFGGKYNTGEGERDVDSFENQILPVAVTYLATRMWPDFRNVEALNRMQESLFGIK